MLKPAPGFLNIKALSETLKKTLADIIMSGDSPWSFQPGIANLAVST
jgi:hypothetical protein